MTKHTKRSWLVGSLAAAAAVMGGGLAEGQDEIIVRGSSRFALALKPLGGSARERMAGELRRMLEDSGYFKLGPQSAEAFVVSGGSGGTQVDGVLEGSQGQELFRRRYRSANFRTNVARLADDIIEAVSGVPGINATTFVFVGRSRGKKEIFRCNGDGSGVLQLTSDRSISVSPSLSPKGDYVAYTSYVSGYPDIYTINLSSRQRSRIVSAPGTNGGAAISPDGGRIACTMSFSGNKELYVMGRNGGRARGLTRTAASESSPAWSPDGSEIIYSSDQSGRPQLFRMSASGGTLRPLSLGFGYCTEPAWSPDGNRLAFTARAGGIVVVLHDFRTGSTRRLAEGEDPCWAPDSRHLAFARGGSLFRLNVDSGEVKRLPVGVSGISEPSWGR